MDDPPAQSYPELLDADAFASDVRWLIRLRWIAVVVVVLCLFVGWRVGWMHRLTEPLCVAGLLAACNAWWDWRGRTEGLAALQRGASFWRRRVLMQLHVDLLALTAILHWTGGFENPFSSLYVFPVAIATMLLPLAQAFLVFGSSFTLFLGLIACEVLTTNRHRPFVPLDQPDSVGLKDAIDLHPVFLTGVGVARFTTLLGTVVFLSMLLQRLRQTEAKRRRHEQVALSRERLARVGTMSAGLAHSIRNPLHGALNCISLLRDPSSEEERRTTLNLLEEGLQRIQMVTQRLMDMTREAPFAPEATDLRAWITSLLQPFHLRNYATKKVVFTTDLADVPEVMIDRHRIYESLFNVIANAIDALPANGGHVHVAMTPIADPFAGVAITVTDNGHGIAKEHLERVFDPFFTTKPIGEGTGLGLAIARQEVERHGGEIILSAVAQGGTCATIRLPHNPFAGN